MDDMIYRNDPIAEENIDPHGRPATMNSRNGAKRSPNGQIPDTRTRK